METSELVRRAPQESPELRQTLFIAPRELWIIHTPSCSHLEANRICPLRPELLHLRELSTGASRHCDSLLWLRAQRLLLPLASAELAGHGKAAAAASATGEEATACTMRAFPKALPRAGPARTGLLNKSTTVACAAIRSASALALPFASDAPARLHALNLASAIATATALPHLTLAPEAKRGPIFASEAAGCQGLLGRRG
mmetsp:Transcript_43787/g.93132  ORF Transcript_43787/g.93132 Transcript_43787/m.93132 type:complete len:200 (+) Transcript_43787:2187-2786(+)